MSIAVSLMSLVATFSGGSASACRLPARWRPETLPSRKPRALSVPGARDAGSRGVQPPAPRRARLGGRPGLLRGPGESHVLRFGPRDRAAALLHDLGRADRAQRPGHHDPREAGDLS